MTHPQQTTREVLEQCVQALNHCMDAITERGLNGSPDQAEKWGLQLPLVRAKSAITAAQSMLANPTPSTAGEADEYQYRTKPTWDANAPWRDWTKCNRGSFEDYKRTPVHNDWIYEARALFAVTQPQATEPVPSDSDDLIKALADVRDLFPIPERGSKLEHAWMEAVAFPESVPAYVRACIAPAAMPVGELPAPFHPSASHINPDYRDGWNAALAATQSAGVPVGELTDEQIEEVAKPFVRALGGDHWYSGEDGIPDNGRLEDFARAILAAARSQP